MSVVETLISEADEELVEAIDAYVLASPSAYAYHRPAWARAIHSAYGFDTLVFAAVDGENLVGTLQLTLHRGLKLRTGLCSSPYCDFGGVVADTDAAREALMVAATHAMQARGVSHMELRSLDDSGSVPAPGDKASLQLPLPESTEALMSGYKAKLRSQIRKARKNGLTFSASRGADAIADYHAVYAQNMRDLGSPPHARAFYEALDAHFGDDLLIGLVHYEDRCVGAGTLLFSGENVSIPWASTLREFNRLAPNMLLYADLLDAAIERGCTTFDFGRSDMDGGTFRFKRQWGAEPRALDWRVVTADNPSGQVIPNQASSRARQSLAQLWSRLPVSVSTAVGARLRRFISL